MGFFEAIGRTNTLSTERDKLAAQAQSLRAGKAYEEEKAFEREQALGTASRDQQRVDIQQQKVDIQQQKHQAEQQEIKRKNTLVPLEPIIQKMNRTPSQEQYVLSFLDMQGVIKRDETGAMSITQGKLEETAAWLHEAHILKEITRLGKNDSSKNWHDKNLDRKEYEEKLIKKGEEFNPERDQNYANLLKAEEEALGAYRQYTGWDGDLEKVMKDIDLKIIEDFGKEKWETWKADPFKRTQLLGEPIKKEKKLTGTLREEAVIKELRETSWEGDELTGAYNEELATLRYDEYLKLVDQGMTRELALNEVKLRAAGVSKQRKLISDETGIGIDGEDDDNLFFYR